jgi:hypothetical protein
MLAAPEVHMRGLTPRRGIGTQIDDFGRGGRKIGTPIVAAADVNDLSGIVHYRRSILPVPVAS